MSGDGIMEDNPSKQSTNIALSIFNDVAVAPTTRPITLAAIEANVMISVHVDKCVECTTYAHHVKDEFLGARTSPIDIGDVEKAVKTAFPALGERLSVSPEEVQKLWGDVKSLEWKYQLEREAYDDVPQGARASGLPHKRTQGHCCGP